MIRVWSRNDGELVGAVGEEIELEKGTGDPVHQQVFQAALQSRSAVVLEANVMRDYDGNIAYVKVPIGYPKWHYWERMHRSHTYRCVDANRSTLWLFRFLTFKKERLTPAIMNANEPWLYREPDLARACTRDRFLPPGAGQLSVREDVITWPDGREELVMVPEGYPPWNTWKVVPGTETFQSIELEAGHVCLYRQSRFQKKPLTQGILHADDPWFHRECLRLPPIGDILTPPPAPSLPSLPTPPTD